MASNNQVKVIISGDDQLTGVFKRVEQSTGSLIKGIVGAFSLWEAGNLVKDTAMMAARFETMGVVMGVVGNNAGYTRAEMDQFAASLRETGIAAIESQEVLTRMAQANIDLEKATTLARIAQDAAVIGNINSSEAFERLVDGIQSAQVDVLRTIGLNVNFEQSYKSLATQLGKTSNELTEQEKMQARTNVVMQAGAQIAGSYEAAMGTAGKQILSMQRYTDDLKVSVGQVFTPALALTVKQLSDGLKDANTSLQDNRTTAQLWGASLRSAVISVEAEVIRMSMLIDKVGGSMTALGALVTFGDLDAKFREWNKLYESRYQANDKRLQDLADLSVALENEAVTAKDAAAAQKDLEEKRIAAGNAARAAAAAAAADKPVTVSSLKKEMANVAGPGHDEWTAELELRAKAMDDEQKMLDEISMASMPLHQQQVEEITRKYADWENQLVSLAAADRLTMEQASEWSSGLAANMQTELDQLAAGQVDLATTSQTIWEQAQRNMVDYSQDAFFNVMKGEYDSLGEQFEDMLLRMIANWEAAQLQMALFGSDSSANAGIGNGLISMGVDYFFNDAATNAGVDAALTDYFSFMDGSTMHSGGLVGRDGTRTTAPAALWNNAPRLHSGLLPDEFPAILQRGETVIPRGQAAPAGVVVNVINNASGTQATASERTDAGGNRVIDVMVEQIEGKLGDRINRGKGLAPTLERRYALNSAWGMSR